MGSVIFLFDLIEVLRRMMAYPHAPTYLAFEIVCLRLVGELQKMLPFLVLASAMMTFFRLNQRSEITVMRTSGVSTQQMLIGLCLGVFVFGVVQLIVLDPVRAMFTQRLYTIEERVFNMKRNTMSVHDTGLWIKEVVDQSAHNHVHDLNPVSATAERIIHAPRVNFTTGNFDEPTFYLYDKMGQFFARIDGTSARLTEQGWVIQNGSYASHAHADIKTQTDHGGAVLLSTDLTLQKIRESNAVPETLSLHQIYQFITLLEKSGLSSLNYRMYYNREIARIGLVLTMILLAAGFSLRSSRSSKSAWLISLCILSGLILYFLNDFLFALGLGGRLHPMTATWALPILGSVLSLAILTHAEDRR